MATKASRKVGIAELKARLSQFVRHVRKGERVVVLDRGEPVADIVPHDEDGPLEVVQPARRPWPEAERELLSGNKKAAKTDFAGDVLRDRKRRRF